MDFIVGTFNTTTLHTLRFTPSKGTRLASLKVLENHSAIGSHSWLALSPSRDYLYCTAWTEPPSVVSYRIDYAPSSDSDDKSGPSITYVNSATTASRSGYVAVHPSGGHLYSVGGPSGEVFTINQDDGSIGELVQTLSFIEEEPGVLDGDKRPHGDFGGLRHGAHSVDVSPDGKSLFIADIGRNCVWTYSINLDGTALAQGKQQQHLTYGGKNIAPRATDGPRHTTPHFHTRVLYSLQEHTSMVDAFRVEKDGVTLTHLSGVKIIPADKSPEDYWADEVRLSNRFFNRNAFPGYLYASTRGLKDETKGYVAAVQLDEHGELGKVADIWETPTSGGWANAVEPAPSPAYAEGAEVLSDDEYVEFMALTDSEHGWVFILGFNAGRIKEIARVKLPAQEGHGKVAGAATAVWLW